MIQRGHIFKKKRVWFARWRRDEIVKDADGNPRLVRRQHCEKLCDVSDRYRTKRDVQPLLDEKLQPLNEGRESPESTLSVSEYAEKFFLPWADRELRPATAHGYRALWKTYLKARVEKFTVRDFRCVDATNLLRDLHQAHELGRSTLKHTKSLLSAIFAHAKRAGVLDGLNPVRDAGIPRAAEDSNPTRAYSPAEITAMLDALDGTAKLAVALMFFAGLRPSEARALRWSDYNPKTKMLRIARSMWRGFTNEPKTEASIGSVPAPQTLADVLDAAPRTSEYILTSPGGKPVDLHNLASRVIRPALAKCVQCGEEKHEATAHEFRAIGEWYGFYGLRRGCATLVASLDSPLAAKGLLRHANVSTTMTHYIKDVPSDVVRVVQKVDALFEKTSATALRN